MTLFLNILELFWTFFKIGAFTFGGGYAMLPLVQQAVLDHGWLARTEIIDFIAVSESTPGPFAINIATYVGSQRGLDIFGQSWYGAIFGAFLATLGVVLPSFIIILVIAKFYEKFKSSKVVSGCMSGLKPAVVGLISAAVISIGATVFYPAGSDGWAVLKTPGFYVCLVIFLLSMMVTLKYKKVSPIYIIIGAAVLGVAAGYVFDIPLVATDAKDRSHEAVSISDYGVYFNSEKVSGMSYKYDENGNIIECVISNEDSTTNGYICKFDDDCNEIERTVLSNGKELYKLSKKYDENGNMTEEVKFVGDNEEEKDTYKYNEDGIVVEWTHYENGQEITRETYEYNGDKLQKTECYWGGIKSSFISNTYDKNGNLEKVMEGYYLYNDGVEGDMEEMTPEYGVSEEAPPEPEETEAVEGDVTDGVETQVTVTEAPETEATETEAPETDAPVSEENLKQPEVILEYSVNRQSFYKYDANNNLIEIVTEESVGGNSRITYSYDEKGNCVLMISYAFGEEDYRVESAYDDSNRVISKTTKSLSGITTTQTYKYDEKGNVSESTYLEDDPLNGKNEYTLTYNFDENGRIVEIIKTMSSGDVYRYKYAYKTVKVWKEQAEKIAERNEELVTNLFIK